MGEIPVPSEHVSVGTGERPPPLTDEQIENYSGGADGDSPVNDLDQAVEDQAAEVRAVAMILDEFPGAEIVEDGAER